MPENIPNLNNDRRREQHSQNHVRRNKPSRHIQRNTKESGHQHRESGNSQGQIPFPVTEKVQQILCFEHNNQRQHKHRPLQPDVQRTRDAKLPTVTLPKRPKKPNLPRQKVTYQSMLKQGEKVRNSSLSVDQKEGHKHDERHDHRMRNVTMLKKRNPGALQSDVRIGKNGKN